MPSKFINYSILCLCLVFSNIGFTQTNTGNEGSILDFMPAIIAGSQANKQTPPPIIPPPGGENLRIVRSELRSLSEPKGTLSNISYTWNDKGNLSSNTNRNFNLFVTPTELSQTTTTTAIYDSDNNPRSEISITKGDGFELRSDTTYIYNNDKRLSRIVLKTTGENNNPSSFTPDQTIETIPEYDVNGRLVKASVEGIIDSTGNAFLTDQHTFGYNAANRVNLHKISRILFNGITTEVQSTNEITITHKFNSSNNLIERTLLQEIFNHLNNSRSTVKVITTLESFSDNQLITRVTNTFSSENPPRESTALHETVTTYEPGACNVQNQNSARTIENTISGGTYSPNIGECIARN